MARTLAELPKGSRLTDFISLGVIAKWFPREQVDAVPRRTGKESQRELPAHGVVYCVIALALYMRVSHREVPRCLLEGLSWPARGNRSRSPASRAFPRRARGWGPGPRGRRARRW